MRQPLKSAHKYMENTDNPGAAGNPRGQFDIGKLSSFAFAEIIDGFERETEAQGKPEPLNVPNGWYTIEPATAEAYLRRNRKGANRKASLATVRYYAQQMAQNDWPRTGQAIIFTAAGILADGQHRLWASYLGGVAFDSYVITDVPANTYCSLTLITVRPGHQRLLWQRQATMAQARSSHALRRSPIM